MGNCYLYRSAILICLPFVISCSLRRRPLSTFSPTSPSDRPSSPTFSPTSSLDRIALKMRPAKPDYQKAQERKKAPTPDSPRSGRMLFTLALKTLQAERQFQLDLLKSALEHKRTKTCYAVNTTYDLEPETRVRGCLRGEADCWAVRNTKGIKVSSAVLL